MATSQDRRPGQDLGLGVVEARRLFLDARERADALDLSAVPQIPTRLAKARSASSLRSSPGSPAYCPPAFVTGRKVSVPRPVCLASCSWSFQFFCSGAITCNIGSTTQCAIFGIKRSRPQSRIVHARRRPRRRSMVRSSSEPSAGLLAAVTRLRRDAFQRLFQWARWKILPTLFGISMLLAGSGAVIAVCTLGIFQLQLGYKEAAGEFSRITRSGAFGGIRGSFLATSKMRNRGGHSDRRAGHVQWRAG